MSDNSAGDRLRHKSGWAAPLSPDLTRL